MRTTDCYLRGYPPAGCRRGRAAGLALKVAALLVCLALSVACRRPAADVPPGIGRAWQADSVGRMEERGYALNSNFEVVSDSLLLCQLPLTDVLPVYKGEQLVVAEFMVLPADSVDSVWVKVARDQETIGWVREKELLRKVVPADSVSQFIHLFSNSHTVAFLVILALFGIWYLHRAVRRQRLQLVWFNDIDSVYPTLLTLLMSAAATLYASIRHFVPGLWDRFYYDPSLNPFELPWLLSLFMFAVWGIIIVGLAALDDLFHQVRVEAALFYALGLLSSCIILYLFFTYTTYYYVGYVCLSAYAVWAFRRIRRTSRYKFCCGYCGAKMKSKGTCPHCGALNE